MSVPDPITMLVHAAALMHCPAAGDKPEARFPDAAAELAAMGHASTLDYVAAAAAAVLEATGLVPHINAGIMAEADLRR